MKKIAFSIKTFISATAVFFVTSPMVHAQFSRELETNPIITNVLTPIVRTMTAGVGLVVVISLIVAGIQYSAARDNPQMVAAAKNRILMSFLALLMFIFGFAVIQWLSPASIF